MGYWENRQAQIMYEYMEDAEAAAKEIADVYAKASRELNYQIMQIYDKFVERHCLEDEEAKKLLNTLRNKGDIQELIDKLAADPKNADLLAEIESQAYGARIERLEQLQAELDRIMQGVYNQEKKVSTTHYIDLAQKAYYRNIYEIQRKVGFQFSFSAIDPKAVDMILASAWSGANYSARIWANTQGVADAVKEQMLLGILTGKSQEDMAMDIARRFATGAFEARRLVRTESNFVSGQIQRQAYEECDAEYYDFIAVLDLVTSPICRELDGKVFPVKDMQPGVNCNPMHPFCRSTTAIHLGDDVLAGLKRRARDPKSGENKLIPASTNYKQWYEQNVANDPEAQAAEKMIKNRHSDNAQYEKYVEAVGKKEAGRTLEDFQSMKYNEPEKWKDLQAFRKYKLKYPDSSRAYYNIQRDLRSAGIKNGVCLPAKRKKAYILPDQTTSGDQYHAMKRMLERGITDDELREVVDKSKVMFSQWGGRRQMFITDQGVAVLMKSGDDWIFKTGWKKDDFDEETLKILEVMKEHGKGN